MSTFAQSSLVGRRLALAPLAILLASWLAGCSIFKPGDLNHETARELLLGVVECGALHEARKDLPSRPLYAMVDGRCQPVSGGGDNHGAYYADDQCQRPFAFRPSAFDAFCKEFLPPFGKDRLGNAATWAGATPAWTLPPAARLDLGVYSIKGNRQPYMKRVRYKEIPVRDRWLAEGQPAPRPTVTPRGIGTCHLEMRVYKSDPDATALKPLLAVHGGGWRSRGTSFVAFESEFSHFTDRGYVVFAPFYRLSGENDGNLECNGAGWREVIDDAESALAWVEANGGQHGARPGKVYLAGGSAGAHLSLWLSTYHPERIARSLLFYPPTDFAHFIGQARQRSQPTLGDQLLAGYLGESLREVDLNSDKVRQSSFPPLIEGRAQRPPPVFIVHGVADKLVPSEQSVRLCNAYAGKIEGGPAVNDGGDPRAGVYARAYHCGDGGSQLRLLAEADHGLDACVPHLSCPSGDVHGQRVAREAVKDAIDWLGQAE